MAKRTFGRSGTTAKVETPKVETKPEPTVPVVVETPAPPEAPADVAIQGDQLALAERLAAKETPLMAKTQSVIAKGREDWQGGPIMTLFSLQQSYSDEDLDFNLDMFPIPGSEAPNNNPDKFKMEYMEGDTRKTKNTTFYAEFARRTPSGRNYLQRIQWCEQAADKNMVKDGIPEDIMNMSPEQRRVHVTFCEGRLKTAASSYRNALRLHFQIKAVEEYGDGNTVQVNPLWVEGHGPDEVEPEHVMLEPGNEPLHVSYEVEGKPIQWEHYSITAFLKLKPKTAEENGGGWIKLRDSGATKKPPKVPGTVEKPSGDELTIKTPDRFLGFIVEEHRWLDEILSEKDRATYGQLAHMLTQKDTDEVKVAVVELKNWLIDMCRDLKLDAAYTKIKSAGSDLVSDTAVKTAA